MAKTDEQRYSKCTSHSFAVVPYFVYSNQQNKYHLFTSDKLIKLEDKLFSLGNCYNNTEIYFHKQWGVTGFSGCGQSYKCQLGVQPARDGKTLLDPSAGAEMNALDSSFSASFITSPVLGSRTALWQ